MQAQRAVVTPLGRAHYDDSFQACKPNGSTEVTWVATVVESTKVQFVTLADSLDMAGEWKLQARVVLPSGTWLGETVRLTVYRPFG